MKRIISVRVEECFPGSSCTINYLDPVGLIRKEAALKSANEDIPEGPKHCIKGSSDEKVILVFPSHKPQTNKSHKGLSEEPLTIEVNFSGGVNEELIVTYCKEYAEGRKSRPQDTTPAQAYTPGRRRVASHGMTLRRPMLAHCGRR